MLLLSYHCRCVLLHSPQIAIEEFCAIHQGTAPDFGSAQLGLLDAIARERDQQLSALVAMSQTVCAASHSDSLGCLEQPAAGDDQFADRFRAFVSQYEVLLLLRRSPDTPTASDIHFPFSNKLLGLLKTPRSCSSVARSWQMNSKSLTCL